MVTARQKVIKNVRKSDIKGEKVDKNNNNSQNSREPNFNRELKVNSREHKIAVPSAHARMRSVFSSVIDDKNSGEQVAVVKKHSDKPVVSHLKKSPIVTKAPFQDTIKPQLKPRKIVHLDNMTADAIVKKNLDSPKKTTLHQTQPTEFAKSLQRVARHQQNANYSYAKKMTMNHSRTKIVHPVKPDVKPILKHASEPKFILDEPVKNQKHDLMKKIAFETPAADLKPEFDLFSPNSVNPAEVKMKKKEKKLAFAKLKNDAKKEKKVKTLEKVAAQKTDLAKKRADLVAKKAENRKVREDLLASQELEMNAKDSFAGKLASAAETETEFSENIPNISVSENGAIAKTQPKFVVNVAGKSFEIGGGKNFAKPNVKISMPKIEAAKILGVIRFVAIVIILSVSGYLAWDTWMTNRDSGVLTGASQSAMSIAAGDPSSADPTAVSAQQYSAYTVPADEPRYITIDSIGVNSRVQKVGVTSNGNIGVPQKLADTAWYDGSAKLGQNGQVFIDGHTSFNKTQSSFNNLPNLKVGDKISIQSGAGANFNYRVVETETVPTEKVDMNKALNVPAGAEKGLTLMTCAGKFDYQKRDATERLVVYAVQE